MAIKTPASRLTEEYDEIDRLPFPREAKADLKALITVEYLTGYADGYQRGKAAAEAEHTLAAFAG